MKRKPVYSREPWCSWCGAFSGQPCISNHTGIPCRTHVERNDPSHGKAVVVFHPPMLCPEVIGRTR